MRRAAVLSAVAVSVATAFGIPALAGQGGKGAAAPHGKAKGHGREKARAAQAHEAKRGKTAICHATGSAAHRYVRITISDHALDAHRRHHGGADAIPAPADGGCG